MSVRRVTALTASALLLAGVPAATVVSAHAQPTANSSVSVLHAVPGVDVYVNGKALLTNFKPGTLTDPVNLPEGSDDLKVTAAGAGAGAKGKAVIEANDVKVPAGASITVVAHLSSAGKPVLTPYVNDVSKVAAGKGRLTVRHDAAADKNLKPAVQTLSGLHHNPSGIPGGTGGQAAQNDFAPVWAWGLAALAAIGVVGVGTVRLARVSARS